MTSPDELQITLRATLAAVAGDWDALMDAMHRSSGGPTIGSPSKDVRLPGGTDRLDLIEAIRRWLAYWVHSVQDEVACAATGGLYANDVYAMVAWLPEHAEWIANQHDAPEEVELLVKLAKRLHGIVEPAGVRRPAVGPCPHVIDGQPCYGTVRAQFGHEHGHRDLICDANSDHAWDALRWKQLARDIDARAGRETADDKMTGDDLAAWMSERFGRSIQPATIRKWASRYPEKVKATEGKYDRVDVTAWYIEREAERIGA